MSTSSHAITSLEHLYFIHTKSSASYQARTTIKFIVTRSWLFYLVSICFIICMYRRIFIWLICHMIFIHLNRNKIPHVATHITHVIIYRLNHSMKTHDIPPLFEPIQDTIHRDTDVFFPIRTISRNSTTGHLCLYRDKLPCAAIHNAYVLVHYLHRSTRSLSLLLSYCLVCRYDSFEHLLLIFFSIIFLFFVSIIIIIIIIMKIGNIHLSSPFYTVISTTPSHISTSADTRDKNWRHGLTFTDYLFLFITLLLSFYTSTVG